VNRYNILTREDLEDRIESDLMAAANNENIQLISNSYVEMLEELLERLYRKYGAETVILIDDFDAPAAMHVSNPKLARDNCDVLYDFFDSIGKNNRYIRLAFMTGITRFAENVLDTSRFNFYDISFAEDFSGICGFSVSELESLFGDRFVETLYRLKSEGEIVQSADTEALKSKITEWYGGYNWSGSVKLLNPYSVINFFNENKFQSY
jgi:hypothetical protein